MVFGLQVSRSPASIVASDDEVVITAPLLKAPLHVRAPDIVAAASGPVDVSDVRKHLRVLSLGAQPRRGPRVSSLSIAFRSPQHIERFTYGAERLLAINARERRSGVDIDAITIWMGEPGEALAQLGAHDITVSEDLAADLAREFGRAHPYALAARRALQLRLRRMVIGLVVPGLVLVSTVPPLRLAVSRHHSLTVTRLVTWWLVASIVGGLVMLASRRVQDAGRRPLRITVVAGAVVIGVLGLWLALARDSPVGLTLVAAGFAAGAAACVQLSRLWPPESSSPHIAPQATDLSEYLSPQERAALSASRRGLVLTAFGTTVMLGLFVLVAVTQEHTYRVTTDGPAAAPPDLATEQRILTEVQRLAPLAVGTPIDAAPFNERTASQYDLDVTGLVDGYTITRDDGWFKVNIEHFDSREHAVAFQLAATRWVMNQYEEINRVAAPVVGATSFTCKCGAAWVTFLRGDVRVFIYMAGPAAATDQATRQLAEAIDEALFAR